MLEISIYFRAVMAEFVERIHSPITFFTEAYGSNIDGTDSLFEIVENFRTCTLASLCWSVKTLKC
jgi:hypothetical protein